MWVWTNAAQIQQLLAPHWKLEGKRSHSKRSWRDTWKKSQSSLDRGTVFVYSCYYKYFKCFPQQSQVCRFFFFIFERQFRFFQSLQLLKTFFLPSICLRGKGLVFVVPVPPILPQKALQFLLFFDQLWGRCSNTWSRRRISAPSTSSHPSHSSY